MLKMHKRYRSDAEASNVASALVEDVLQSLEQTSGWKKLKMTVDAMMLTIEKFETEKQALKHPKPGGSKPGRSIIQRNFELAFNTLRMQYFVEMPVYSDAHFRRRFRMSKMIFGKIYSACLDHPYFEHKKNAAGRWGIHPLVKIAAVLRRVLPSILCGCISHLTMTQASGLRGQR